MRIKAGRYALALVLITCGILVILNKVYNTGIIDNLWYIAGGALVLFGLEIITLSLIYSKREDVKIEISISSILLTIVIVMIFAVWTNKIQISGPFPDFNIDF